jgi:hypothetical protein
VFIYTQEFDRLAEGVFTDEELRQVELQLMANPNAGVVIPGTGGVRKLRVALPGRGKRGSARFIYFHLASKARLYFLTLYTKNRQATLSEAGKQRVRAVADAAKEEQEP